MILYVRIHKKLVRSKKLTSNGFHDGEIIIDDGLKAEAVGRPVEVAEVALALFLFPG